MAHTIYKKIEALQTNPEYAFDEVPMPYDISINAIGAGTKGVDYSVVAARQNTPLSEAESSALKELQPIKELQKALQTAATPDAATSPAPVPARYATVPESFRPDTGPDISVDMPGA